MQLIAKTGITDKILESMYNLLSSDYISFKLALVLMSAYDCSQLKFLDLICAKYETSDGISFGNKYVVERYYHRDYKYSVLSGGYTFHSYNRQSMLADLLWMMNDDIVNKPIPF